MKNITKQLSIPIKSFIKILIKYSRVIIFVGFSFMVGIITVRVGEYSSREPSTDQIAEVKKNTTKIDEESLSKLKELEDRNVSIEALFNNGRTNPFEN